MMRLWGVLTTSPRRDHRCQCQIVRRSSLPFAALTGYDAAIKETGRLTDDKIELDEEALTALDMKYQLLMDALDDAPEVTITYFQPDERKAGGKYIMATGALKKVDDFERRITMQDGTKIPMDDVISIDGELFSSLE